MNVTVAVVQPWWRVDDWFRPVDADGTPHGRSRHVKSYDVESPFWFRYAGYLTLLLFLPVTFGIAYGGLVALAVRLARPGPAVDHVAAFSGLPCSPA